MNIEQALKMLRKMDILIWTRKDGLTCPIGYPKKWGSWEYMLFFDNEKEPCLLTNSEKELIKFVESLVKECNEDDE